MLLKTRRADLVALTGLLAAWAGAWAVTWPSGNFPLNDDWVYALAVRSILEAGRFSLPSPATANVIAQAYWGALFCLPAGFSFDALRFSTFALGGMGVLSISLLVRELGGNRSTAIFAGLSLVGNPLYLGLSASFMTDVPFTAVTIVSLWLHVRGVRRESTACLAGALAMALMAMLIRQFGLALFLAYGVGHLLRHRWSARHWIIAGGPVVLATMLQVGYEHWLVATGRSAPLPIPLPVMLPHAAPQAVVRIIQYGWKTLLYLGLCIVPFMLWSNGRPQRRMLAVGSLSALLLAGFMFATNSELPKFGNVLILSGMGPLTLRDTWVLGLNEPEVSGVTKTVWLLLSLMACAGTGAVLIAAIRAAGVLLLAGKSQEARRRAALPATMLVFIGIYFAGLLLIATLSDPPRVFDRYVLPMIAPVYGLLLMQRRPAASRLTPGGIAASLVLASFATGAVLTTHDYIAWNRARWRATAALANAGISPHRIDGGYEFNGWLLNSPGYVPKPGKSIWWVDDDEYVVASGPMNGYAEVARVVVDRWLVTGPAAVVVLHRLP